MEMETILAEIEGWSRESRLQLVERICDALAAEEVDSGLAPAVKAMLEGRLARHEANPDAVLTWDEIVAHVRRPR